MKILKNEEKLFKKYFNSLSLLVNSDSKKKIVTSSTLEQLYNNKTSNFYLMISKKIPNLISWSLLKWL